MVLTPGTAIHQAKAQTAAPDDWSVEIGASNGGLAPESEVRLVEGSTLELAGNRTTRAWKMVSQRIAGEPGDSFRIRYSARAGELQREGNQFDNCYVGVFFRGANDAVVDRSVWSVPESEWRDYVQYVTVPDQASEIQLIVFLSKSGVLAVRDFSLERLRAEDSFAVLIDDMDRNYSFFDLKKTSWQDVARRYRQRAESAATPAEFADVIARMLAELEDIHVWIELDGKRMSTFVAGYEANHNFPAIDRELAWSRGIGQFGTTAKTTDGIGYVRINTLNGVKNDDLQRMIAAVRELFTARAIIVDLRANGGGAETVGQEIARLFTDEPMTYARQRVRDGAAHHQLRDAGIRQLVPAEGDPYTGPVVCLIGPGTVSSGEGMAMMFAALPHCTLIGLPTRGASGNPAPVSLPNGVKVWYSRWISLTPDGTPIEGTGVQPDERVPHGPDDPAWRRAIDLLNEGGNSAGKTPR